MTYFTIRLTNDSNLEEFLNIEGTTSKHEKIDIETEHIPESYWMWNRVTEVYKDCTLGDILSLRLKDAL